MRFNVPEKPEGMVGMSDVRIGNVYPAKGGRTTRYWVVFNLREQAVDLIGLDANGEISGAVSYSTYVFENGKRPCIGRVDGIENISFDIQWEQS